MLLSKSLNESVGRIRSFTACFSNGPMKLIMRPLRPRAVKKREPRPTQHSLMIFGRRAFARTPITNSALKFFLGVAKDFDIDVNFTSEDDAFCQDVRDFLASSLPGDLRQKVENGIELHRDDIMRWHRIMYAKGWAAPNWPQEHGGPGWALSQKYIFDEERALSGAPRLVAFGINMCGPVLMGFGTQAQQQHFLPRILSGEHIWCQG